MTYKRKEKNKIIRFNFRGGLSQLFFLFPFTFFFYSFLKYVFLFCVKQIRELHSRFNIIKIFTKALTNRSIDLSFYIPITLFLYYFFFSNDVFFVSFLNLLIFLLNKSEFFLYFLVLILSLPSPFFVSLSEKF